MKYQTQILFKNNPKMYEYLKQNSFYIKKFDMNSISFKDFVSEMKTKYKERTTDKIEKTIDNVKWLSDILDVVK